VIRYKHFKCGVQEVNAKAIDIDTIIAGDDVVVRDHLELGHMGVNHLIKRKGPIKKRGL
jgi:hypothetical protein